MIIRKVQSFLVEALSLLNMSKFLFASSSAGKTFNVFFKILDFSEIVESCFIIFFLSTNLALFTK